ncbi:UDP-4-amino-4,6-dideoxy-N-acetyl-beta-L-altrosamine transaminase [Pseudoalteromonas shioyasakiensis]|uniref:UDP-4-amino-4, 6-dideoxy-N-acetyl-beta-L-altrosamine transaminase n=1 Tax=Pseudoalteromonas shioyasakiensis TaxID=1190813 RepID=A0ABT6U0A0_9GAMM|nr:MULTISPECIES: UDP-4-amino-4,6-dideoxy-N-acetyl-beta-L-altrosamine transaminase [Pseudoalteromonas]MDI4669581.1 UDP-4-amino-4,6-dideoxy-N-acetyl-beta-L-altrosamine transaminase [Pseudoalteromonas shioyasakiensis]MDI4674400.1 UDP-4-amino-4,6-dideoxy-N-acetyl-beta-L-altrosamine transaminase [Pseudoalteromonas shioyasakiensis]MDI4686467.1 UDP-4-amino-4,6-dideoxy-N-acetyl-beta-L-altrosamine transaminase [Pseudoalteromonas shioyasakiensis]MDI4704757.1 UDP-4-amino-4,6-dideoxy-N-acetyl-beta-L-altros
MANKVIPYGKQSISQEDINAVIDVLKSDWLTQGPAVPAFESAIAEYCDAHYACATNSATSALHIACLALGVGKGDIVWTSPISFVASSNCALYCGADIDFVDIDLETGNMSVAALQEKLTLAKQSQQLPKVVIPVHLAGQSCDMAAINALAKEYGFKVIEDASHAIGAKYKDKPVGSCIYSDITVFSFHPVKIITSAEGGMAVTNCAELNKKMSRLRSHGITNIPEEMTEPSHGPWYYQQLELGFNYRMTDMQAALGLSQLKQLDNFVSVRNDIATTYNHAFANSTLAHLTQSDDCYSSYHLYIVRLTQCNVEKHKSVITGMREQGVIAHLHYIPIHLQPYYQALGFSEGDYPNAETYYKQAVTIPLHPTMTANEQQFVIDKLIDLL